MSEQPSQPTQTEGGNSTKAKVVPLRALVINLLFSMFTSLVIFAVASYYFLVPQMLKQSSDLQVIKAQVQALAEQAVPIEQEMAADEEEPTPDGEAQVAADTAGNTAPAADREAAAADTAADQPAPAGEPNADEAAAKQEAPAKAAAATP